MAHEKFVPFGCLSDRFYRLLCEAGRGGADPLDQLAHHRVVFANAVAQFPRDPRFSSGRLPVDATEDSVLVDRFERFVGGCTADLASPTP